MINKIYVILPIYNEGESIYNLLKKYMLFFTNISSLPHEIVAINDNSSDDSEEWILKAREDFQSLHINYIKHPENSGLANVLYTGFSCIGENLADNDIIITMDGDDTHNPFLIREMINKINEGADIVIASRYCEQSRIHGLSNFRIFLSSGARYLYSFLWNIKGVRDYTCGFRCYKAPLVKKSMNHYGKEFIQERGFTVTAETLKKMSLFNPVIVEIPMILRYSNKFQTSNMKIFKTVKLTLQMLFRSKF
jgi:dolichol-phosphate mannosyltransferase